MAVGMIWLVLLVVFLYLLVRNLLLWQANGQRPIDGRAIASDSEQRLRHLAEKVTSVFTGRRGRFWQIFGIVLLIIIARSLPWSQVAWLALLSIGTMILMSVLRHQTAPVSSSSDQQPNNGSQPVDKPVPLAPQGQPARRVPTPEEYILQREHFRRRSNRLAMWLMSLAVVTGVALLMLLGISPRRLSLNERRSPVVAFVQDHVPQLRNALRDDSSNPSPATAPQNVNESSTVDLDEQGLLTIREGSVVDPVHLLKARKLVLLTTDYDRAAPAEEAVTRMTVDILGNIVQSNVPAAAKSGWRPSADWTLRHFPGQRAVGQHEGGTYQAQTILDAPGEKEIEQLIHEFRKDEKSERAWTMLKGYAGGICILGGLAVIVRLGTSRRLPQDGVSYRKRWFGRARLAEA